MPAGLLHGRAAVGSKARGGPVGRSVARGFSWHAGRRGLVLDEEGDVGQGEVQPANATRQDIVCGTRTL